MWNALLRLLGLSCRHHHLSKPFSAMTAGAVDHASSTGHYIICMDCGRKFAYDWDQMRIVS